MGILKTKADQADLPTVRYEVKGEELDMSKVNRLVRKTLESVGRKQQKLHANLVHPETRERPEIVIAFPDLTQKAQVVLKTDSTVLRAWLEEKGIVLGRTDTDSGEPDTV